MFYSNAGDVNGDV